jgi:hypothetical protein
MTVLDVSERYGRTDLTERLSTTTGRDSGVGTFARGTLTRLPEHYHVRGSSRDGLKYRTLVSVVAVGYDERLDLDVGQTFNLSDLDFRLGDSKLSLRTPPE